MAGVSFAAKGVRNKKQILWPVSVLAVVKMKESVQDEYISSWNRKPKDCRVPGFVATGGSEQNPPAQHLQHLHCVAFVLLSERGEFIPSAAQNHTYFIAISLSGNIFSNHFPM